MNRNWMALRHRNGLLLIASLLLMSHAGRAWSFDVPWTGTAGDGNWNSAGNWNLNEIPEADLEGVGVINNGDTVHLSAPALDAAGVILGQAAGDSGTLQILSGGSINFIASTGGTTGTANISLAGPATLDVRGGGSMSTALLDVNNLGNVIIGQGTGTASLTSTGGMFLDGMTTVRGPNATFSAAGNVTFEGNSRFVADITAATHSPLKTTGAVTLNGVFRPQISNVTPVAGNRWDIVDAASIGGSFSSLDFSSLPSLPTGQAYRTLETAGGSNGRLLQLGVDQFLTLRVNWDTKAVSIVNTGTVAVSIDTYEILSALGGLNPAQGVWNSLHDQNVGGANIWREAAPTSTGLSELNPTSSLTIPGGQTWALGTPFAPVIPAQFGVSPEDLVFRYQTPTGDEFAGLIEYTGVRDTNNFRLTIDPTTGQGQLRNDGGVSIALEGYSIQSATGALLTGWNSLDDQNVGGANIWQEANPSSNVLSELNPTSSASISPNNGFALGSVWNTSGARDLQLVFQLANEATSRIGTVVYGALPPLSMGGLAGDYNNDGTVNAADYTLWRNNLGAPTEAAINGNGDGGGITASDYTYWKQHFGMTAGSGAGSVGVASVPEPAAWWLFAAACVLGLAAQRNRWQCFGRGGMDCEKGSI